MKAIEKFEIENTASILNFGNRFDKAIEVPIFYGENKKDTHDFKGIYNARTKELVQVASKHYTVIQHRDILEAIHDSLKARGLNVKGRLDNFGNSVRLDVVFPGVSVKDDTKKGISLGIRATNSYDRARSFKLEMFAFRMLCQNGMSLGKALDNIKEVVFHFGNKTKEFVRDIVSKFIEKVVASSGDLQNLVQQSIKDKLDFRTTSKLLEKLIVFKKHRGKILEKLNISTIEKYDKKKKKRSFEYVKEDKKESVTRWELYNAITNYTSHEDKLGQSTEDNIQNVAQEILSRDFSKLATMEA